MKSAWYTRRFMRMVAGPVRTRVLRAGIHSGLLDALRAPKTADDVARELDLAPDLVASWCRVARECGLLREKDAGYRATPFARFLLDSPRAEAFYALLDQAVETTSPLFDRLPGLMRGAPRPVFGDPAAVRRAAAGSLLVQDRALAALAKIPGVRDARRVLDIGCGYGTTLAAFLQHYRDARGVGVEKESDLAEEARRGLDAAGVGRRAEVVVGDFMTAELPEGGFDLALLNNALYYFSPEERDALFARVLSRLSTRGVLAMQIPTLSASRVARAAGFTEFPACFDLFLRSHANLYGLPPLPELREGLEAAGFAAVGDTPILPGGASLYLWARAGG